MGVNGSLTDQMGYAGQAVDCGNRATIIGCERRSAQKEVAQAADPLDAWDIHPCPNGRCGAEDHGTRQAIARLPKQ